MSLKINIQTAINVGYLDLKEFHKIGWVQYRLRMFYSPKNSKQQIHFMAYNIAVPSESSSGNKKNQCFITQNSHYCYSRKIKIKYLNEPMLQNVSYYFKVYVDISLLDSINVFLNVDLLFSQNEKMKSQVIYQYCATMNVYHNILTYLPVTFDNYGVLRLCGNFHGTIMQYKFEKNEDDVQFIEKQYLNLEEYLQAYTFGFRHAEVVHFYEYYRTNLEKELSNLLDRFNDACQLVGDFQKRPKYIKLNSNKKLELVLEEINHINFVVLTQSQKSKVVSAILQDFVSIKALIYQNWNQFNSFLRQHFKKINQNLQSKYQQQLRERMKANIFSHRIKNHDWTFNRYDEEPRFHLEQAESVRKKGQSESELWKDIFPIQDTNFYEQANRSIKIFEQIYETGMLPIAAQVPQQFQHVIILVHGFQAHSKDLTEFKKCLQARHRNIKVYISGSNVGKTEESIKNMGKRLAIEITRYTQILKKAYKLSFIGHSMGGIIIRSALAFIQPEWKHLHAYVSICSPHLGYLYSPSKLVQAGLWLLNTWQKCDSITELSMQDSQNLKECYLYKLAAEPHLIHFKKISFISSSQDQYVPYESALVVKNIKILKESLRNRMQADMICEMVDNMLCQVQASEINRVDVIFNIEQTNFDSFIGRTGHVKFLSDPYFIKQFVISLSHLFL